MGYYVSRDELIARFEDRDAVAHLTDGPGGTIDDDVLDEVIASAEAELNGYLAKRYHTPVDITGDTQLDYVLRGKALDLAQYNLLARGDLISPGKQALRDQAIEWCKDVARGVIVLPAEGTPATTDVRGTMFEYGDNDAGTDSERRLTRDRFKAL